MRTDQQKKGTLHLYLFDYQQVKGEGFIKETILFLYRLLRNKGHSPTVFLSGR